MNAIEIDSLSKAFGNRQAIDTISLSVSQGEIYGFLGPNGAGKTTTIRCLMDFIRPDSGSISVLGLNAQKQTRQVKQQIGYMSADNHLYGSWTGSQHLAFAKAVWGTLPRMVDLCQRLQLDTNIKVKHLSTGNHQKLGLVMAMAHNPKLLILDEPTRGLDPLLQQEFQKMLIEFKEQGGTVFISSHNLSEVEQLCTRVGIIKNGRMVASQSMADIRAFKVHLITATFRTSINPDAVKLPDMEVVQSDPSHLVARVHGDINPLVQKLSKLDLSDLEINHLPLEEVFMSYYQEEKS